MGGQILGVIFFFFGARAAVWGKKVSKLKRYIEFYIKVVFLVCFSWIYIYLPF